MTGHLAHWHAHLSAPAAPALHHADAFADADALAAAAHLLGFAAITLDATRICSKADLLAELATAAGFPSYFGHNWDAASDLLRDLRWTGADGHVLIVTSAECLDRLGSADFATFVKVLESAILHWRGRLPFHVVFFRNDGPARRR